MEAEQIKPMEAPAKATPAQVAHEPRNFLVAFLLAAFGGYVGLRHFYLGNAKLGWLRAGLFIGGYLFLFLMVVIGQPAIAFLGALAILTAAIWAIVDLFYVYFAVKTDADNQPLTTTARDKRWAKIILWVMIIGISLSLIGYVVATTIYYNNPSLLDSSSNQSPFENSGDPYLDGNDTVY